MRWHLSKQQIDLYDATLLDVDPTSGAIRMLL